MDVSAKTLREVEFREKMRGYHPEDVDQFLEEVAVGVEALHERLRQVTERAQRAESAAADASDSDETLRRTLVLAQRTADLAVQEAREQAARLLAGAEQQAQGLIADAEERARRMHEDALSEVRAELAKLETVRTQAESDVATLTRWVEEHRAHLGAALHEALGVIERIGTLAPPPASQPVEVPRPAPPAPAPTVAAPPEAPAAPPRRPDPVDRPDVREDVGEPTGEHQLLSEGGGVAGRGPSAGPDDQALDEFFDDPDFADDDRRFGGRLRRRR